MSDNIKSAQLSAKQAFDDGTPPPKRDALMESCAQFLESVLPAKNVILEYDWRTYGALFNTEEFNKLTPDKIDVLVNKYYMRFSMQHPIIVIANEYDDSDAGVFYPVDGHKHKKIREFPPVFRSVLAINELGGNATDLVTMFMNTTRNQTPINDRTGLVRDAIIAAIKKANQKALNDDEAARAYAAKVRSIEDKKNNVKPIDKEEEPSTGFTDDMPWE